MKRAYRHRANVEAWQWKPPCPIPDWLKFHFHVIGSPGSPLISRWRATIGMRIVRPNDYIVRHDLSVWRPEEFKKAFEEMK